MIIAMAYVDRGNSTVYPDVYAAESPCQAGPQEVRSTDLMLMVTERHA